MADDFESVRSKYTHKTNVLHEAFRKHNLLFVISNTQNNLTHEVTYHIPFVNPVLRTSEVLELRRILVDYLEREFYFAVITYPDRYTEDADPDGTIVLPVERDNSTWRGDSNIWKVALGQICDAIASSASISPMSDLHEDLDISNHLPHPNFGSC